MAPSIMWLVIGAAFLAIEAFGIPGLGFLFGGIAAIITGVAVETGAIDATNMTLQFAVFFASTALFAVILWKPLKKWRTTSTSGESYSNMVGDSVKVGKGGLSKGALGTVTWSGTTMRARLAADAGIDSAQMHDELFITSVDKNILTVAPQKA